MRRKLNLSQDITGLTAGDITSITDGPCSLLLPGHTVTGDQVMDRASVIFADDNILLRKFLRMSIQEDPQLSVVNEASNGFELLRQLEITTPDIVILDISMPHLSGLKAAKIIKEQYPNIKIVILTLNDKKSYFRRACDIGVDGYVLKDEIEQIHQIITTVLRGKKYISSHFK